VRTCINVNWQVLKQQWDAVLNAVNDLVNVLGLALLHYDKAIFCFTVLDPVDTLQHAHRKVSCGYHRQHFPSKRSGPVSGRGCSVV
jgi:hypothetical protein